MPLPELTIYGYGKPSDGFDHFITDRIGVGTKYIPLLPITNNYSDPFDRLGIEFTRICDGGVLNQLTRNSGSIVKILNKLANAFTPFLTAYSNMDLGLPRNSRNCESCAAYIADYVLDDSSLEVDDSSDYADYYEGYWRYLHTLVGRDNPERIYERMSHMSSSDALSEFGISRSDIHDACRDYDLEFND